MPTQRSTAELAREITAGAVRLTAATAAWLALVAEFDERQGWAGYGIRSCAEWLAWQCGLSPGPAREHVRVARALRRLPLLAAAFTDGRLSYSKLRALTRVAEPGTEAYLLDFARQATASQTERTVRQWRRADREDTAADEQARQRIDWWWDENGMLVLTTRLPAEAGAALIAAIESRAERDARRDRAAAKKAERAGERRAEGGARCDEDDAVALSRQLTTARRCAALSALAEAAADRGRRPGDPPRRQVVVHVDAALLADDTAAGRAFIDGGPALTAAQARRLMCEGTALLMLERDREVLAVGRRRRLATRAQRLALLRRDGGCARPGCTETRIERLHAHHLRHWLHGGRTDLTNLVLLCDTCHGLTHDLDLTMTRRHGRLVVTTPDGRRVWGPADATFTTGTAGLDGEPDLIGVHPVDAVRGRRPDLPSPADEVEAAPATPTADPDRPSTRRSTTRTPRRTAAPRRPRRPGTRPDTRRGATRPSTPRPAAYPLRADRPGAGPAPRPDISALLFPAGEPPLPAAMHVNGERMDLRYVVGLLMEHRDTVHRLEAEAGATRD